MEAYVTRREFENVLKELRRLQCFLTDVFGNKFSEFQRDAGSSPQLPIARVRKGKGPNPAAKSSGGGRPPNVVLLIKPSVDPPVSVSSGGVGSGNSAPSTAIDDAVEYFEDPLNIFDEESSPVPIIVTSTRSLSTENASAATATPIPTRVMMEASSLRPPAPLIPTVPIIPTAPITIPLGPTREPAPRVSISFPTPTVRLTTSGITTTEPNQDGMGGGFPALPHLLPLASSKKNLKSSASIGGGENGAPPKRVRRNPLPSFRKRPSISISTPSPSGSASTTTSESEIIQCEHCQLFIYSSQLAEHVKNHSVLDGKNMMSMEESNNDPIYRQQQTCPMCQVECEDFQAYEEHCKTHQPSSEIPCPVCEKTFHLMARLRRHMLIHKNLKFTCDICGKCYNRRDNLAAHSKIHDSENPEEPPIFYCGVCKRNAFASREGRDRHMKSAHPNHNNIGVTDSELVAASAGGTTETIILKDGLKGLEYEGEEDEEEEEEVIALD